MGSFEDRYGSARTKNRPPEGGRSFGAVWKTAYWVTGTHEPGEDGGVGWGWGWGWGAG